MLICGGVSRVSGGRDMCILFVRRIRSTSNGRDEEGMRGWKSSYLVGGVGGGNYGRRAAI